jgi:hypothetical protein
MTTAYLDKQRLAWLPESTGRLGAVGLARVLAALDCLVDVAERPSHSGAEADYCSALEREDFFRFGLPFAALADRKAFRDATATAFRAKAFPWARDPIAPILALEVDALCAFPHKPLSFVLTCHDLLKERLSSQLGASKPLTRAFDAYFESKVGVLSDAIGASFEKIVK